MSNYFIAKKNNLKKFKFLFIMIKYIGKFLSWVVTRIILGVIFYVIVTPLALAAKLLGKKFLEVSFKEPGKESYWEYQKKKKTNKNSYQMQF